MDSRQDGGLSVRDNIQMTDAQILARFEAEGVETTIDALVFTRETVDNWREARASWAERGQAAVDAPGVLRIVNARVLASQPRHNITVIDMGEVRAVDVRPATEVEALRAIDRAVAETVQQHIRAFGYGDRPLSVEGNP